MKKAVSAVKMIGMYFRTNLSGALEYRESFLISAFGMALSNSAFVFFWWVAFDQIGGQIGGYDFRDVMFIWAASSSAFGFCYILFGNTGRLSELIVNGSMDTYLLQPKNVLLSTLCSGTQLSAWGDLMYGFILMALTGQGPRGWLYFFVAVLLGCPLFCATSVFGHTLAFFFGDSSVVGGILGEFMINFSLYPEGIFKGVIRFLMYTLIPAAFAVHIPLRLARGGSVWWLAIDVAATALYCFAAYRFFMFGLKRYESGNLIATRM